jgi:phosphomannomutase
MRELKIGTSWVRGVVGDALNPELVVDFACAFGTWGDGGPVVIGRDTRSSSPMLRSAVVSGLLSAGCEVIDLGICPSPLVSFAVRDLGAAGGISITGSHNDARWNALKFVGPDGVLLNSVKSEELLDIYHAASFLTASWHELKPVTGAPDVVDRYEEQILASLDTEAIRARRFRVAVDFCNGACGEVTARVLKALGCTLFPLNEEPHGQFAHAPAPSPANMRQLGTLVKCLEVDFGAAMNVDGDRIGFVTSDGTPLSEEHSLPLAADVRLARRAGPVVTSYSTSRMIDAVSDRYGQRVTRTLVGEGYVLDRGLYEGAALAGEGSGGVAMLPGSMTYDSLLTLGMVLESMAVSGNTLEQQVERLPKLAIRKGELACPAELVYRAVEGFRTRYADRSPLTADGVQVEWDDAWLHVRASNTEPLMRVICEAESADRANMLFEDSMNFARRKVFGHEGA